MLCFYRRLIFVVDAFVSFPERQFLPVLVPALANDRSLHFSIKSHNLIHLILHQLSIQLEKIPHFDFRPTIILNLFFMSFLPFRIPFAVCLLTPV
jgi:hypothetical protein